LASPALAQVGNGYYQSAHTIHFYDAPYPEYRPAYPSFGSAQGYYFQNRVPYFYGEPYPDYGYRTYPYTYGYYQPAAQQTGGYGKVTVSVPRDAQVTFNDLTSPEGYPKRWFETPALRSDRDFTVKVHATWSEGGSKIERTRSVVLHAGDNMTIDLAEKKGS
jgi:uncharacterized protein (TIGR03000 family)